MLQNQKSLAGLAEDPSTRILWQTVVPGRLPQPLLMGMGPDHDVDSREVLIVAKRGAGAKYIQDGRVGPAINQLLQHYRRSRIELKKSRNYIPPKRTACAYL
jgi:hypothetical protein